MPAEWLYMPSVMCTCIVHPLHGGVVQARNYFEMCLHSHVYM